MGLRDFFFEKVESTYEDDFMVDSSIDGVDTVVVEQVVAETLIEDIYAQNNLSDKTKSIFKVEELVNSLPKEMPNATKKASVIAILGSFGLTVTDVFEDGSKRIETLSGVLNQMNNTWNAEIEAKKEEIENHKKEIERLEKEISDTEAEKTTSQQTVYTETYRIEGLRSFIGGE